MNSGNINHYFYIMHYFFLWIIKPFAAIKKKKAARRHAGGIDLRYVKSVQQSCLKKSLPLSSTRMNAGKSSTSIFQTASMPSSG